MTRKRSPLIAALFSLAAMLSVSIGQTVTIWFAGAVSTSEVCGSVLR